VRVLKGSGVVDYKACEIESVCFEVSVESWI
jgi:hypothetical protein